MSTFWNCRRKKSKLIREKSKPKSRTKSSWAGFTFLVGHFTGYLRQGRYSKRLCPRTDIFAEATLEYLMTDEVELVGNVCGDNQSNTMHSKHWKLVKNQVNCSPKQLSQEEVCYQTFMCSYCKRTNRKSRRDLLKWLKYKIISPCGAIHVFANAASASSLV